MCTDTVFTVILFHFFFRVVIHIVSEVSDVDKVDMLDKYVRVRHQLWQV